MTGEKDGIEDAALDWVIRSRDRDFDDWEGLETWLAADPTRVEAYHAAALEDEALDDVIPLPIRLEAPPGPAVAFGRRAWLGGAVAASLAILVGYGAWPSARDMVPYETAPGQRRTVTIDAGTALTLNGGTRVEIDRADPRFARVERGQALFRVRHDSARPFRVEVAGATLVDVGTVFQVTREARTLDVAVTEGEVVYNPDSESVRLPAGRALRVDDGGRQLTLRSVEADAVTGWTVGRLIYAGTPLATVAADLSRNLGVVVAVAPGVAARPVQGVLTIEGPPDVVLTQVAPLLGVRVRRQGDGWLFDEAP